MKAGVCFRNSLFSLDFVEIQTNYHVGLLLDLLWKTRIEEKRRKSLSFLLSLLFHAHPRLSYSLCLFFTYLFLFKTNNIIINSGYSYTNLSTQPQKQKNEYDLFIYLCMFFSVSLSSDLSVWITPFPSLQIDCLVVSQLFRVARAAWCFKLGCIAVEPSSFTS